MPSCAVNNVQIYSLVGPHRHMGKHRRASLGQNLAINYT